jgi:hypothetical protein
MCPTSVYFNNQNATREQMLVEDLIIESIRNHGIDVWYLPRTTRANTEDKLFGDDPVKAYARAIKIDMYLETFQDYEGNKEFFSKFGLRIDESARLAVARRTFEKLVGLNLRNLPKEGDLIYLPIQMKLMEIRFVEEERNFFQLGRDSMNPYMYVLSIETFKYNGELLNTGIEEIDSISRVITNSVTYSMVDVGSAVSYEKEEQVYQGANLASSTASAYVSDFNLPLLELRLRNIRGEFANGANVIGASSGAVFRITDFDLIDNSAANTDDNRLIENTAPGILDFTESNPFGEP